MQKNYLISEDTYIKLYNLLTLHYVSDIPTVITLEDSTQVNIKQLFEQTLTQLNNDIK